MRDVDAELVGDKRRGDPDRLRIDAVEQVDEGAANDDADLKPGDRSFIDELRYIDLRLLLKTTSSPPPGRSSAAAP
jgi:hypothetical protein